MPQNLQAVLAPPAAGTPIDLAAGRTYRFLVRSAIVLGLAAILFALLDGELFRLVRRSIETGSWSASLLKPGLVWMAIVLSMMVGRTLLWFRYRPAPAATMDEAPTLTVIIPAYNEGPMVATSIESVVAAAYPRDRLQVVVVDDGSTDDTWEHIERAAARYPGLVATIRFPTNRGKRAGLAAGFRRARGEIVVTIDSDSVIEPGTLLSVAGAFRDPKVGAVAGRVAVYNRGAGVLPRMLHVRYTLSFDFLRAVQSTYGTVYCCPGALAAYRTSVVLELLDGWLGQTFLGAPCTYGEDRALTNAIFSLGYDAVYQRTAVVHTVVPETYRQLCKMFLRWDRSYIREEIRFARIVWRRPLVPMLFSLLEKLVANVGIPLGWISLAVLAAIIASNPIVLMRLLVAIGVSSAFSMLFYLYSERSLRFVHGIAYSYFAFFTLWWIFPYAIMTVRSRSWMTR